MRDKGEGRRVSSFMLEKGKAGGGGLASVSRGTFDIGERRSGLGLFKAEMQYVVVRIGGGADE